MSLVYDITFSSLPLSSTEAGFFLLLKREKKSAEGDGGGVGFYVFGGGDDGISKVAFSSPALAQLFLLSSMVSLL